MVSDGKAMLSAPPQWFLPHVCWTWHAVQSWLPSGRMMLRSETNRIAASKGQVLPKIPTKQNWMTRLDSNLQPPSLEGKRNWGRNWTTQIEVPKPFQKIVLLHSLIGAKSRRDDVPSGTIIEIKHHANNVHCLTVNSIVQNKHHDE